MIKDTELRKGNLLLLSVNYKDNIHRVDEIYTDEVKVTSVEDGGCFPVMKLRTCNPIPLTPEWLERCGFARDRNGWGKPGSQFSLTDKLFPCWLDRMLWPGGLPSFHRVALQHLHQLQNLYFTLTGEELQIKMP